MQTQKSLELEIATPPLDIKAITKLKDSWRSTLQKQVTITEQNLRTQIGFNLLLAKQLNLATTSFIEPTAKIAVEFLRHELYEESQVNNKLKEDFVAVYASKFKKLDRNAQKELLQAALTNNSDKFKLKIQKLFPEITAIIENIKATDDYRTQGLAELQQRFANFANTIYKPYFKPLRYHTFIKKLQKLYRQISQEQQYLPLATSFAFFKTKTSTATPLTFTLPTFLEQYRKQDTTIPRQAFEIAAVATDILKIQNLSIALLEAHKTGTKQVVAINLQKLIATLNIFIEQNLTTNGALIALAETVCQYPSEVIKALKLTKLTTTSQQQEFFAILELLATCDAKTISTLTQKWLQAIWFQDIHHGANNTAQQQQITVFMRKIGTLCGSKNAILQDIYNYISAKNLAELLFRMHCDQENTASNNEDLHFFVSHIPPTKLAEVFSELQKMPEFLIPPSKEEILARIHNLMIPAIIADIHDINDALATKNVPMLFLHLKNFAAHLDHAHKDTLFYQAFTGLSIEHADMLTNIELVIQDLSLSEDKHQETLNALASRRLIINLNTFLDRIGFSATEPTTACDKDTWGQLQDAIIDYIALPPHPLPNLSLQKSL